MFPDAAYSRRYYGSQNLTIALFDDQEGHWFSFKACFNAWLTQHLIELNCQDEDFEATLNQHHVYNMVTFHLFNKTQPQDEPPASTFILLPFTQHLKEQQDYKNRIADRVIQQYQNPKKVLL